jgi:hypothetical protein
MDRRLTIDITPPAFKTPEEAAKAKAAIEEFDQATANLANCAEQFLDTHEEDILHCMAMYEGVAEDLSELRELIVTRRHKQRAFLEACAG